VVEEWRRKRMINREATAENTGWEGCAARGQRGPQAGWMTLRGRQGQTLQAEKEGNELSASQ
jgi:hypothetical protein